MPHRPIRQSTHLPYKAIARDLPYRERFTATGGTAPAGEFGFSDLYNFVYVAGSLQLCSPLC